MGHFHPFSKTCSKFRGVGVFPQVRDQDVGPKKVEIGALNKIISRNWLVDVGGFNCKKQV
jgi:hypothetical protein